MKTPSIRTIAFSIAASSRTPEADLIGPDIGPNAPQMSARAHGNLVTGWAWCATWFGLLLTLLGQPGRAAAQGTVPDQLSFQGYIVDGSSTPLGSTTPAELPVTFRIFSGATGGTALWAESQTVTFDKGNYSVMLGQGTSVPPGNGSLGNLVKTTQGSELYVETTVTINGNDARILPRMRLLPTPYAFLAKNALSADSASIVNGTGIVGLIPDERISDTIRFGAIADSRLSANVALRNAANTFSEITVAGAGGNSFKTHNFAGFGGAQLVGTWTGAGTFGPQVRYNRAGNAGWWDVGMNGADYVIEEGDSPRLTIKPGGNVLINTSGSRKLQVGENSVVGSSGMIRLEARGSGGLRNWEMGVFESGADLSDSSYGYSFVIDDKDLGTAPEFAIRWGTGHVGIGTSNPTEKLQLGDYSFAGSPMLAMKTAGGSAQYAGVRLRHFSDEYGFDLYSDDKTSGLGLHFDAIDGGNRRTAMFIRRSNGHVGIGNKNPQVPLDVTTSASYTMNHNGYYSSDEDRNFDNNSGGGIEAYGMWGSHDKGASYTRPVSIRAAGWIVTAKGVAAYSDRRIKRDIRGSVTANDLAAIQQLRVADYRLVDPDNGGVAWQKGFIAQEVEQVMPGAVARSAEFVPDIFSLSTKTVFNGSTKTLALSLSVDHGLKVGDQVRLHADGSRLDLVVSAVPSAREFVVDDCPSAPQKVFVYGRQVADFRTVDYSRVFTTGIGAIQELARKVEALEARQSRFVELEQKASRAEATEKENAALRAKLELQDKRLAALELLVHEKLNGVQRASLDASSGSSRN